jgi:hypothetical protein
MKGVTLDFDRADKGDFTPRQHFDFENAAWFGHLVDVVWPVLFIAIHECDRTLLPPSPRPCFIADTR